MADNLEAKIYKYVEDEADDILSFFDLRLSTSSDSADFFDPKQSLLSLSPPYSSDDTLFEFPCLKNSDYPVEKMLFFGKLISSRREITEQKSKLRSDSVNWAKRVEEKSISHEFGISRIDKEVSNLINWAKEIPKIEAKKLKRKSNSFNWGKRVHHKGAATANQQWLLLMCGRHRVPASNRSSGEKGSGRERKLKRKKQLWRMIKVLGCL